MKFVLLVLSGLIFTGCNDYITSKRAGLAPYDEPVRQAQEAEMQKEEDLKEAETPEYYEDEM